MGGHAFLHGFCCVKKTTLKIRLNMQIEMTKGASIIVPSWDSALIVYFILKYIQCKMPCISVCETIARHQL